MKVVGVVAFSLVSCLYAVGQWQVGQVTDPMTDRKMTLYAVETTATSETKGGLGIACDKGKILKAVLQMPGYVFRVSSSALLTGAQTDITIRIGNDAPSGFFHHLYSIPDDHTLAIISNNEIRRSLKEGRVRFRTHDVFNTVHDLDIVTTNLPSSFQEDCGR